MSTIREILEQAIPPAPPRVVENGVTYWVDEHIVLGEN